MWGLYRCVCASFFRRPGVFIIAIWVRGLNQESQKTLHHKFESCYRLSFFSMPICFSGIRASVVKSCGDLRVCVCILSSGLPGCFLGDVGEWSKPRVCKTLFHKFESCHRLSIFCPVIFLRTSGLPIKNVVGCIFLQRCPDFFFLFNG